VNAVDFTASPVEASMATERYRVGDLVVDAGTGAVTRKTERVELPPLSFKLLVALLRHAPDVVKRRDLIDEVWDGALVNDEALSQRVRLLRESLGDKAAQPRYVASVRGWGYRIAAPAERLGSTGRDPTTVAVLPFSNLGGVPEDEPLCEGLAESIIDSLTRVAGLRVIARTSSFIVSRLGLDVCQAGRRLGAENLLEGSVRRSNQRVRVTVQLLQTSDGGHLWSEQYDRELVDVLELEDDIAAAVATRLREGLKTGTLERRHLTVDPAAHQAYLEGRYHFGRTGPEALAQALTCLERAVARDPSFAPAFDALAELYWYLGFFGGVAPRDAFAQGTWYALRALELDESLAETHALLAMLRKELDYNWPEVDRELARARELNPGSPTVRLRYAISGPLPHGRLDEALTELDEVLTSDPLSPFVRWWSGAMAYLGKCADRAVDEGRQMIALDASHFLGHWVVGMGKELDGDLEAGLASMERANELSGGIPFTLGFLAYLLGRANEREAVRAILEGLRQARLSRYVSPFASALGCIGLGDWDDGLGWMDAAIEQRDPLVMPILSYGFLDPIRDDPRFAVLLQKMHLI
jgi:adenylate cyclase